MNEVNSNNVDEELEEDEKEDVFENEVKEVTTTAQPPPPAVIVDLCQSGNGGCDHNCRFVHADSESAGRVECSCYAGFVLNDGDQRTCHGESQF